MNDCQWPRGPKRRREEETGEGPKEGETTAMFRGKDTKEGAEGQMQTIEKGGNEIVPKGGDEAGCGTQRPRAKTDCN